MERYIYYSGQKNWTMEDFDYLNSFLNKIFQNREKEINKYRISHMNLYAMEDTTKALLKALLLEQKIFDEIVNQYENLKGLKEVKPLERALFLQKEPCYLFKEYTNMNIML